MLMNKKLHIIYGGPSSEREVSFETKDYFIDLFAENNPIPVEWLENFSFKLGKIVTDTNLLLETLSKENSLVIIASHGEYVEDGYLQELLEENKIEFTGSDSKSCKLSMDKCASFEKIKTFTDLIPTYSTLPINFNYHDMTKVIKSEFPIFAKPNNLGSSIGIYKISNLKDLEKVVIKLDNIEYLFQPAIKGTEVSLGVVREGDSFMNLFPTEIISQNEFFDYKSKYEVGGSKEITPARISPKLTKQLQELTNKIHRTLGLGYYSRSDFIIDENDTIYYLETNSLPGMTKTSLLPRQLVHACKIGDFKVGLLKNTIQPKG